MKYQIRPAKTGDGQAIYDVTRQSVRELSKDFYGAETIAGWMGQRDADFYEQLIANGRVFVAAGSGENVVAFVDTVPGEITRLFVLPIAAGNGLGGRLMEVAIDQAAKDFEGPIIVESSLNAEQFYNKRGFQRVKLGMSTHDTGGAEMEVVHMERPTNTA